MSANKFKIVFMGTPHFAAHSLGEILKAGIDVACVITGPDRPAGRGQKEKSSAVKMLAKEKRLDILQPEKLKAPEFLEKLSSYNADMFVVVAFRMLPEAVWAMPPKGTINLHASLLPDYRGAAPINHAIINGEKKSGITTFFIEKEIDTGKIIDSSEVKLSDDMNAGMLHDRLMERGAELLVETIQKISRGEDLQLHVQPAGGTAKHAPKIFPSDCYIDWSGELDTIYNKIRGLSPYPGARTKILTQEDREIHVKIFSAEKERGSHNMEAGRLITDNKEYLKVAVKDGFLVIKSIQLPGKKAMATENMLRGNDASRWVLSPTFT